MVAAVLVDLDDTLWDRDQAFRALVDTQHRAFPELAAIPRELYVTRVIELHDRRVGDKRAAYAQVAVHATHTITALDELIPLLTTAGVLGVQY
jgi:hypothetical protein